MFNRIEKTLGILIDGKTVRVALFEKNRNKWTLLRALSQSLANSDDITLGKTLEDMVNACGAKGLTANLAVADSGIGVELVPLPKMKGKDLYKVVNRHAARIASAAEEGASEVLSENRYVRETNKGQTTQDEHLIVATAQGAIDRYIRLCERAGIKIQTVVPFAEAQYFGLRDNLEFSDDKQCHLVVDFNLDTTHVGLVGENSWIFSRELKKGIAPEVALTSERIEIKSTAQLAPAPLEESSEQEDVTEESQEDDEIDQNDFVLEDEEKKSPIPAFDPYGDEEVKLDSPFSLGGEEKNKEDDLDDTPNILPENVLPGLLISEIRRTVLFLEREYSVRISKIIFTGIIPAATGLLEEFTQSLDRPVEWPNIRQIDCPSSFLPYPHGQPVPYTACFGAALAGFDNKSLNLLPKNLRPERGLSLKKILLPAASILIMVGLVGFTYLQNMTISDLEEKIKFHEPFAKRAEEHSQQANLSEKIQKYKRHATGLKEIQKNQSPAAFLLEQLKDLVPEHVKIENFRIFRFGDRWIYHLEGGVISSRRGKALEDYIKFIDELENSPLIENAQGFDVKPVSNNTGMGNLPEKKEEKKESKNKWGAGFGFRIRGFLRGIS